MDKRESGYSDGDIGKGIVVGHTQLLYRGQVRQTPQGPRQLQPMTKPQLMVYVREERRCRAVDLDDAIRIFPNEEDIVQPDVVREAIQRARKVAGVGDEVRFRVRFGRRGPRSMRFHFVGAVVPDEDGGFGLNEAAMEALEELRDASASTDVDP